MPIISMFYGIIIRMYFLENQQHGAGETPYKIDPL